MDNIDEILQGIDERLEQKNAVREGALSVSRRVVQHASKVIRAVHRHEWEEAQALLQDTATLVEEISEQTGTASDLYWTGYVQDAQKEYAEAHLTLALVRQTALPLPKEIGVEDAAYLNGLAEAASELRRYILDLVRHNELVEADRLLDSMEEVYSRLITIDYPHAITNNLRRTTDQLRGVLERTRGDVTVAMKQQELKEALRGVEARLAEGEQ
ncbi:MAG: haloacid dehalogenase [Chloroflexota bacterium]|nr:haloacid dehalogenase [Chloroflexota bacterium]